MKGMYGCSNFISRSKKSIVFLKVPSSICRPNSGLIISKYHEQKSSHTSEYKSFSAGEIWKSENNLSTSTIVALSLLSNHSLANSLPIENCKLPIESTCQPFTNLKAFQSLLLKFLPCSISLSSKSRSFPAGEEIKI